MNPTTLPLVLGEALLRGIRMADQVIDRPDGGADVYLGGVGGQVGGDTNKSEVINIVPFIKAQAEAIYPSYYNEDNKKTGEEMLSEMGQIVCEEYELDESSRKDWCDRAIKSLKLFKAYMDPKTWPWENCSNVHLPLLTVAVIQFHARAYEAIVPAKGVVQVLGTEIPGMMPPDVSKQKADRADRVEKYMNYQLLYEMDEFEDGMDKLLIELPCTGSSFKKTYYDAILKRPVSRFISSLDVVFNYGFDRVEEAQRVTHVLEMYQADIRKRAKKGIFDYEVGWKLKGGTAAFYRQHTKSEIDTIDGMAPNYQHDTSPRIILEQQRGWDIDGSGIPQPVIITVDYETKQVLRITSRNYTDALGQTVELNYYTQYNFLPNPNGGYGVGYGTLMSGLNESAISILNEVIDAGSLANLQGGFVTKRSGVKKGNLTFNMGEYKEIETYVDDIRKAIYQFDFKGPNNTLYAVLGLLYEYSKLVASVSETMTGQLPASDTPATTVLALLEEGRKVFSSIHKRVHRSFKRELRQLYRINSIFLNTNKYFNVLTSAGIPSAQVEEIARADFAETYNIIPVSDPSIISRAEKLIKAQHTRDIVLADPVSRNNTQNIYNATVRFLETMDTPAIDEVYSKPAAPQDTPPVEENSMFLTERPSEVLPQQDHAQHLQIHNDLVSGTFAPEMTPAGKNILTQHIQQHKAGLYMNSKRTNQGAPQ